MISFNLIEDFSLGEQIMVKSQKQFSPFPPIDILSCVCIDGTFKCNDLVDWFGLTCTSHNRHYERERERERGERLASFFAIYSVLISQVKIMFS